MMKSEFVIEFFEKLGNKKMRIMGVVGLRD